MNNINMPGFTAEVSLYKTINHYHMIEGIHQADGTVHAAQFGDPDDPNCFEDCRDDCLALGFPFSTCIPLCMRVCDPQPPVVTCGRCVGFQRCSDGSRRPCSR